jgi:antitoxin component YwqK of YwqJK toxin-antitoxin module
MNLDELVDRRGVYLHPQTLEAYSGPVVATWDGSIVRERGTLQNGRWHGVRETFYLDSRLEVRETYRNGVLHGPFESYFRTGRPSDKGTYEEGQLEGLYEAYWSRTQGDIHAAHSNAAGAAGHEGHAGMEMAMPPGDVMERGTWHDGRPCGEWYRFLPRNSQGMRTGETVQYPPCPAGAR